MKLHNQPTNLEPLKTFQDSKGNQYKLVGQKDMLSSNGYPVTNYYELYKKEVKNKDFVKYGAKEEVYVSSFYGFAPSVIQKERFNKNTGKLTETYEITKVLNGYEIECKNESLTMNGPLSILHAKDNFNKPITKIKLPSHVDIFGFQPFSNMTKRIMKLFQHVK